LSSFHDLESDLWVPAPIDKVWALFSDPKNLVALTPESYHAEVEILDANHRLLIRVSPFGKSLPVRFKWISQLKDFQPEGARRSFRDIQVEGPFAHWEHEHIFEEGEASFEGGRSGSPALKPNEKGAWIRDRVQYAVPFGPIGEMAHRLGLKRQIASLFAYRREALRRLFP